MKQTKTASTERCSWCSERAKWRSQRLTFQKYACEQHKGDLSEHERKNADDGHMSEADYQTWGRL